MTARFPAVVGHLPHWLPLGLAGLASWGVWLLRWTLSRRYRPVVNDFHAPVSVVVPSYREDPDVLMRCLATWLAEDPFEVIVVPDLADAELIARLNQSGDPRLQVLPIRHQGKRSALAAGMRAATGEIIVLCDSDTAWEAGLLAAVQMPFADRRVGAVGTRQSCYARRSSLWRRVADWLVNTRYLDYVPAMGRAGGVACASGRTAAYRRSVVVPLLPLLEDERFLGRRCVAGDDGRLTWLVLSRGYRVTHQDSARAISMFPDSAAAFFKQRIRWSRNSYRCYLTAAAKGWLWRQPLVTQITVLQILLTPLSMAITLTFAFYDTRGAWRVAAAAGALVAGRVLRSVSHLREHPEDLWLAPLMTLVVIVIALPVKTYALLTCNRQGWLTRSAERIGGEAQSEASVGLEAA